MKTLAQECGYHDIDFTDTQLDDSEAIKAAEQWQKRLDRESKMNRPRHGSWCGGFPM